MNATTEPEVSVIITAYNVERFIGLAVQSALDQTMERLEVIVVDDASTDDTADVVRRFDDPRLRLIQIEHGGVSRAANAGVAAARGKMLAFLDGDDLWSRDKLRKQLDVMRSNPAIDLTFTWYLVIDEDGGETGLQSRRSYGTFSFEDLVSDNVIGNGSLVLVRASVFRAVEPFDTSIGGCSDLDAWLRVARVRPGNIACVPEFLACYRRRKGQITSDVRLMESSWNKLMDRLSSVAPEETARAAPVARSNMYRYFAFLSYENQSFGDAAAYLWQGFRQLPMGFFQDARNWRMAAAILSGFVIPAGARKRIVRAAMQWSARGAGP